MFVVLEVISTLLVCAAREFICDGWPITSVFLEELYKFIFFVWLPHVVKARFAT